MLLFSPIKSLWRERSNSKTSYNNLRKNVISNIFYLKLNVKRILYLSKIFIFILYEII